MMGVMAKSRVSIAAVMNTEVRDVLGAIVEEEGMDYEGWVILQGHGVCWRRGRLGHEVIFVLI